MTAAKWAAATKIYNDRLERLAQQKGFEFLEKNPRALMDKLADIEPRIVERLINENFTCT